MMLSFFFNSEVDIFQTLALGDLVANLLIDCADIEVFDSHLLFVLCHITNPNIYSGFHRR
jgi:hypothetical protein